MNKEAIIKELKRERQIKQEKKEERKNQALELWNNPDYESLRSDHTKQQKGTERAHEIVNFYIAIKMIDRFGYSLWMSNPNVVGHNNERINNKGEVYTANKFIRKTINQSSFVIERVITQ